MNALYELPENRIALHPTESRDSAKLLVSNPEEIMGESLVRDLPQWIVPSIAHMVGNASRVVKARLLFPRGENQKPYELFFLEPANQDVATAMGGTSPQTIRCLVGLSKKWKPGMVLEHPSGLRAKRIETQNDVSVVALEWSGPKTLGEWLEEAGNVPLPPYLHREAEKEDAERYQTIYAQNHGSVAAPTAGLHFTPRLLDELSRKGVSFHTIELHVGAGTFKPVESVDVADHLMHAEEVHIPLSTLQLMALGEPVMAIGTTSARSLESAFWIGVPCALGQTDCESFLPQWAWKDREVLLQNAGWDSVTAQKMVFTALVDKVIRSGKNELVFKTALMIVPGYTFRTLDALLTNFHQPDSSLLFLVSALLGEQWRNVYSHALKNNYRFLSYGDACLFFVHKKRP